MFCTWTEQCRTRQNATACSQQFCTNSQLQQKCENDHSKLTSPRTWPLLLPSATAVEDCLALRIPPSLSFERLHPSDIIQQLENRIVDPGSVRDQFLMSVGRLIYFSLTALNSSTDSFRGRNRPAHRSCNGRHAAAMESVMTTCRVVRRGGDRLYISARHSSEVVASEEIIVVETC